MASEEPTTDVEDPVVTSKGEDKSTAVDGEEAPPATNSTNCWYYAGRYSLSLLFSLLFIYSFVVQFNDTDGVGYWAIFYLIHGIFAVLGLINLPRLRPAMTAVAAGIILWSFIMIIITSIELSKTEPGGSVEGGDNNKAVDREEKAYELAGACLGMVSGIFHFFLFKYSPPPPAEIAVVVETPNDPIE